MRKNTLATNASNRLPVEVVEIDRRQFLRLAGGGLIALGTFGLVGCGGSGVSTGGTQGMTTLKGSVQLPSGVAAKVGPLTTANVYNTNPVGTNLQFSQGVTGQNPSLAYVQDAQGRVILMGFLDPSLQTNLLSPASTATALIFFALDGYALPPANMGSVLSLIAKHPATAVFATTIQTRIAANPYAVDGADAQLSAALLVACNAIKGTSSNRARAQARPTSATAPLTSLLITGANPQGGFSVNQDSTSTGFIGQNSFRRYAKVYLYETGTVDSAGVKHLLTTAKQVGVAIDVPSTERLNLITSLQNIFTTTSPFAPVSTSTVPLSLVTNTNQTLYDIVVVGSSSNAAEPAFFSDPIYATAVTTWRQDIQSLNLRSCFADVLFGLILNLLGVTAANALPGTTVDTAISDLTTSVKSVEFKTAIATAAQAANPELIIGTTGKIVINSAGSVSFAADSVFIYGVADYLATAAGVAAVSAARTGTLMKLGFRVIVGIVTGASLVLGAGDLTAVIHDLAAADRGDIWNAAVIASTLTLSPLSPNTTPGSTVNFTVKLPAGFVLPPSTTVVYDWSQTGGVLAILTDNKGISGASTIETPNSAVSLVITPSQQAPIVVTVSAYIKHASGTKILIDTASTTVTVGLNTSIVPGVKLDVVIANGSANFLAAFATFTAIAGAGPDVEYTWKSPSVEGNVVYGTTFQTNITSGQLPLLDLSTDFNKQISNAPGGAFSLGGNLVGFFGGYIEFGFPEQPTLAQAETYMTGVFTNPPAISVIQP